MEERDCLTVARRSRSVQRRVVVARGMFCARSTVTLAQDRSAPTSAVPNSALGCKNLRQAATSTAQIKTVLLSRSTLESGYRHVSVGSDFIPPGGTANDRSLSVSCSETAKAFGNDSNR